MRLARLIRGTLHDLSTSSAVCVAVQMVQCAIWHETSDVLAAVSDGKLITWLYPAAVFVDSSLVRHTRVQADARSVHCTVMSAYTLWSLTCDAILIMYSLSHICLYLSLLSLLQLAGQAVRVPVLLVVARHSP